MQALIEKTVSRLQWCWTRFREKAAIGTSLQGSGLVILDLAYTNGFRFPVFTVDTGLLFPETLALKSRVEERLGISIESLHPEWSVEEQAIREGERLWERDPDRCCHLRKVLPLEHKLDTLDVWITGLRRDQSPGRKQTGLVDVFERQAAGRLQMLIKISPLADWTKGEVDRYLAERDWPVNKLLAKGYKSIGCWPCTKPPVGEDERSGRWQGKEKTECGIHTFLGKESFYMFENQEKERWQGEKS